MSETNTSDALDRAVALAAPTYGDSVVKSETVAPTQVGPGGEPVEEPAKPEPPKEEPPKEEPKPEKRREDPRDARIRQLTAKLGDSGRDAARRIAELEAEVSRYRAPPSEQAEKPAVPHADEIERLIEQRAAAKVAERQTQAETAAFNRACNSIATAGEREYGEAFQASLGSLWGMLDGPETPRAMIEAAMETDSPAAVLYHLSQNLDEAQRISELRPAKMGAAVAKIATALAMPAAAPKPAVSRAPAPVETVGGSVRAEPGPLGPKSMSDFVKWADERDKAARRR